MKSDFDKIDDAVLALLHLTSFRNRPEELLRAWKGHDWEVLGRLHEKNLIGDPVGQAKSIVLTEEGARRAEQLFKSLFCAVDDPSPSSPPKHD